MRVRGGDGRGRGHPPVHRPGLPRAAPGPAPALRQPRGDGHRGPRGQARGPARRVGAGEARRRSLPARPGHPRRRSSAWGRRARRTSSPRWSGASTLRSAASSTRSASATWARPPPARSPTTSRTCGRSTDADRDALTRVKDVGPEMAKVIAGFFAEPQNREGIEALLAAGVAPQPPEDTSRGPFAGKTVVLTGTLGCPHSRAGEGGGGAARREGLGQRLQEDRLRGRGRGLREQAEEGEPSSGSRCSTSGPSWTSSPRRRRGATSMEHSAVHLVVVGRVQGVAFRARAVAEATPTRALGLGAEPDGRHRGGSGRGPAGGSGRLRGLVPSRTARGDGRGGPGHRGAGHGRTTASRWGPAGEPSLRSARHPGRLEGLGGEPAAGVRGASQSAPGRGGVPGHRPDRARRGALLHPDRGRAALPLAGTGPLHRPPRTHLGRVGGGRRARSTRTSSARQGSTWVWWTTGGPSWARAGWRSG